MDTGVWAITPFTNVLLAVVADTKGKPTTGGVDTTPGPKIIHSYYHNFN